MYSTDAFLVSLGLNKLYANSLSSSRLALRVLHLAQRQYSLLQAANLLTPDMISEFETLQQLVLEESVEHGAENPRSPGLAREDPLAQELCSESSECHLLIQPLRSVANPGTSHAGLCCGGRLEPN